MQPHYSKSEIVHRYFWTNNFRLTLGLGFFIVLILLNVFRIELPVNVFVMMVVGLFVLFYSILTLYYLQTEKASLTELVFLTTFLSVVDLFMITIFIYFSGGYASLYFVGYFLFVALVPFWAPYFKNSPNAWAAIASGFYITLLGATMLGFLPYIDLSGNVSSLDPALARASFVNMLIIPVILLAFAQGQYYVLRYLRQERVDMERGLAHEKDVEKQYAAFSSVFWILTHVHRSEQMLDEALDKILKILDLKSGMIMLLDPRRGISCGVNKGVPEQICQAFKGKRLTEVDALFSNLKGIFLGKEFIQKEFIRKLVFRQRTMGFLVLFSRDESVDISAGLNKMLDAVADEMAAAIFYAKFFKALPKGRQDKNEE